MQIESISASSAQVFETCEARFNAEYIDRTPKLANEAGSRGSAVHEALQMWVEKECHLMNFTTVMEKQRAMRLIWEMVYYNHFSDDSNKAEGWQMLDRWLQRTDLMYGRTVLATEQKKSFKVNTSRGELRVNYIIDRLDELADKSLEVIDYKTVAQPVPVDRMKQLIQPRLYAIATMIEHKGIPGVWVTYDLLRYDRVGVYFTRDDCLETWGYLHNLAERIYASDGTRETLNPECRFCVRKSVCNTLHKFTTSGNLIGTGSLEEASNLYAVLDSQISGLQAQKTELQGYIMTLAEQNELLEWDTPDFQIKVSARGQRHADSERVRQVVGTDIFSEYGNVGIGKVDEMLKDERLTYEQKSLLKQLVSKQYSAPYLTVKPKTPFSED